MDTAPYRALRAAFCTFALLLAEAPLADDGLGAEALTAHYATLAPRLAETPYRAPIQILSSQDGGWVRGEVYGVVHHPFEITSAALAEPSDWCDILFLHTNVKACTVDGAGDGRQVVLHIGRKYFQRPEETHRTATTFRRRNRSEGYLQVGAEADEGPFGIEAYSIAVEAVPIGDGRSFLHFSYAMRYGFLTRTALAAYFATLGFGKVGFTRDEEGDLVGGMRGMIERNAMRNYLAIIAHLDTLGRPAAERYARWFDATERYPRQLREMERSEYLRQKAREREENRRLEEESRR